MPPAVEIARAIGATPVSLTGTALDQRGEFRRRSEDSAAPDTIAASCNNPIATGDSFNALRRKFDNDCLPRGADSALTSWPPSRSGRKATCRIASPDAVIASRSSADSA